MTFCSFVQESVLPGLTKTDKGDQKRSFTPSQAITAGADYLVIGRPITAAAEPELAWNLIVEELKTFPTKNQRTLD